MIRRILSILISGLTFIYPLFAFADALGLDKAGNLGLEKGLEGIIANIIKKALTLVGTLALAFLVYGGFLYITAAGDTQQIEKGKKVIIYAIIGIIVIGLAYALVEFVIGAFGGGSGGGSQSNL